MSEFLEVPVKAGLEFSPVVCLDDVHAKGQAAVNYLIDRSESPVRLIARIIDFEDPNARAVVNGGELIQARSRVPAIRSRNLTSSCRR